MKHSHKIFFFHLIFFIAFPILSMFLWGAGHGSSAPLVVFYSPFLTTFYSNGYSDHYSFLAIMQIPLYGIICYLFSIDKIHKKYKFLLPIFHITLALIAIFILNDNPRDRHYYFFAFSLLVMLPYWIGFLRLSRYFK